MKTVGFEFYKQRIKPGMNDITVARFVHWASVAMLREEIKVDDFYQEVSQFDERTATIAVPSNRLTASRFTIGELGVFWGVSSAPVGLYLPHIDNTNDQDAYQLYPNGNPTYEIYNDR